MVRRNLLYITILASSALAQSVDFAPAEPYTARARHSGPLRDLSLHEAIEQSLRNNLQIRIESYNRDIVNLRLAGLSGLYDPTVGFQSDLNTTRSPTTTTLQGGTGLSTQTDKNLTLGPSYSENIPGGGSLSVSLTNNRTVTNNAFTFLNPLFGSNLAITFNQPLWRGAFANDPTLYRIRLTRLDRNITDAQFRQKVSEIVESVHRQYWALVLAIEGYETRRQSRELAVEHFRSTREKVEAGILTPVALSSARAEVAIREQDMIETEVQILTAENALKGLMASHPLDSIWTMTLIPIDRPATDLPDITLAAALEAAMEHRPELEQLRTQLKQNEIDRESLKNATRPAVNFRATTGAIGRSGSLIPGFTVPGVDPKTLANFPGLGGLGTSLDQTLSFQYPNLSVGINVQYTVFNRTARADLAQAVVRERQLQATLKNGQQQILMEVRNAFEALSVRKISLETAMLGTRLSQEQLAGETARFQAGFTTNFEVLRYQRDYADAQLRELQAQIDQQIAIVNLRRAMDVLIDASDIALARQQ